MVKFFSLSDKIRRRKEENKLTTASNAIMTVHTTFLCWSFALLWIMLTGVKALPIKSCTDDQYKRILHNGSFVCIDCLRCPMGLGPSVECGSTISADTKIHCEICKTGVSFSPYNDFEQCQSCSVCSEDQVSKPCTSSSDTICKKKCKSKGKYYEKSSDDCQDCTWCCEDGHDILIDECLKKGMPAQKSCTVHRKKLCKPPTTERPSTALPTTLPLTTRTIQPTAKNTTTEDNNYWHLREPTKRKPSNHIHFQLSNNNNSSSVNRASVPTTDLQVLIGVCSGLASLLIVAALIWLLIKCHKHCGICTSFSKESQRKFRMIYTKVSEDEDNIIAYYKEFRLFDLFKDNHELKLKVCKKLDLKKSFARLARCCEMDEDEVKKLEEHPANEPTCQVFDWIEGSNPDFSFGEFANILKKYKRNDVLKCFGEKPSASKEIHVELS